MYIYRAHMHVIASLLDIPLERKAPFTTLPSMLNAAPDRAISSAPYLLLPRATVPDGQA